MVNVTEDQNTAEQVFQSFREVADGKPYVTEMDLRHSLVPDEVIDKLVDLIPLHSGPDMLDDRGMPQYDYIAFMDKLISGTAGGSCDASSAGGDYDDDDVPSGVLKERTNRDSNLRQDKVNGYH
ncbi:hypothetical protein BN1723_018734, partial [Verticillium longisporum]